jgi:hypothetical protein
MPVSAVDSVVVRVFGAQRVAAHRALALFDRQDPVSAEDLPGLWRGEEIRTGHRLDGLLSTYGWYGKEFLPDGRAHPLVFADAAGGRFYAHPLPLSAPVVWRMPAAGVAVLRRSAPLLRPALKLCRTRAPQARVELRECRGKLGASMVYRHLPITDAFRRIDERTLLGMMITSEPAEPFFFLLQRVAIAK